MTIKSSAIAALIATAAVTATATAAESDTFSITEGHLTRGVSLVELDMGTDVTVAASTRDFSSKTIAGVTGVGVRHGNVSGEIDGTESITFTFAQAVTISELQISFLYDDGQFGDEPAEAARMTTLDGDFTLQVTGPTSATWTGLGSVANASVATEAGAGHWIISGDDVFGAPTTSLTLYSGNPGSHHSDGDFSFVSLTATNVPAPAGVGLAALAGICAARRRR